MRPAAMMERGQERNSLLPPRPVCAHEPQSFGARDLPSPPAFAPATMEKRIATVDAVKTLHTSMIDTRTAYEKAQAEARLPELRALFSSMVALRQKDHDELHRVLTEMGKKPDEDGSFMTAVHRAVIGARSAITGVDRGSLSAFASGEENIIKEYDDALGQSDIGQETAALLDRQKAVLERKIAEMKALA